MTSVVPPSRARQNDHNDHKLPLRWALILLASAAAGIAVHAAAGVTPGVTVSISLAGLLHRILPKR
jgi:hypothetical protein